ncbi:MAG: putative hydrolase of the superfamily [Actinomycetota bacterium]
MFKAVLWDFGGVILTSPFEAFNSYEVANGLPENFIRGLNATNPDTNAWAHFERSEYTVDQFAEAFQAEALAAGHTLDARGVLGMLAGEIRPQMIAAIDTIKAAGYMQACLTNNFVSFEDYPREQRAVGRDDILAKFDFIIESSKVGVRKPDPRFYEIACESLGVEPEDCVFLDDLGINLKPARAMGMTTIKVDDPDVALAELSTYLELSWA